MTGFTDRLAIDTLNTIIGEYPYIALFTATGSDDGSGFTEVSGGSYARVATGSGDWEAPSGSSPVSMTNAVTLNFPAPTADWGTVIAWGLYNAPTTGTIGVWDYLGDDSWLPCTVSAASPATIRSTNHGISVNDALVFSLEYGGVIPTFSQSNLSGVLIAAHVTTNTLDVTNSSIQVNASAEGTGLIRKIVQQSIPSGLISVALAAHSITLTLA